jgi:hypothetical protein
MPFTVTYTSGRQEITFSASDFLDEAISDFLESGKNASRFASAIVKVATGVELLLKNMLEQICPALILDKADDGGLQIAKAFGLERRLRFPKEVENLDLRTVAFPILLIRASKFFDIEQYSVHLTRLHKIRNSLVHHTGKVDVLETNLLLVKYVFPFIEDIGKANKSLGLTLSSATWKKIRQLKAQSVDALTSQLAKKIAHHSSIANRLSKQKVSLLAHSETEKGSKEEITEDNLHCPACGNETASIFQEVEVDYDESGPTGGYFIFSLRCRVCGIELDEDEIQCVISDFETYMGPAKAAEKNHWEQAITPPDFEESY